MAFQPEQSTYVDLPPPDYTPPTGPSAPVPAYSSVYVVNTPSDFIPGTAGPGHGAGLTGIGTRNTVTPPVNQYPYPQQVQFHNPSPTTPPQLQSPWTPPLQPQPQPQPQIVYAVNNNNRRRWQWGWSGSVPFRIPDNKILYPIVAVTILIFVILVSVRVW